MCIDLFAPRNPPVPSELWRPTDAELAHLRAIAQRGRTVGNLACELIMYQHHLDDRAHLYDAEATLGLLHRIDETRLLLAMAAAVDETDINIKLMLLANSTLRIPMKPDAHSNLKPDTRSDLKPDVLA